MGFAGDWRRLHQPVGTASCLACINGAGKHPQAANKDTVSGEVGGTVEVQVRNGATSEPRWSGRRSGGFSCPNGQRLVLASVS
jgi:hypothetical protein